MGVCAGKNPWIHWVLAGYAGVVRRRDGRIPAARSRSGRLANRGRAIGESPGSGVRPETGATGATRPERRTMMSGSDTTAAGGPPVTPPARASIAVIGAGIVGNCLVAHLADLGWRDLVLIDKGPLPDPGGSTGHASNFILPDRSQPRDRDADPGEPAAVRGARRQHHLRRHRGGAHRGPHGGAAAAHDLGAGLGHRGRAAVAGRGGRQGAVRQRRRYPGRLLHAERVGGRLGEGGHDHARAGRWRRAPSWCWARPRSPGSR